MQEEIREDQWSQVNNQWDNMFQSPQEAMVAAQQYQNWRDEFGQADIVEDGLRNELRELEDQIYQKRIELDNAVLY